jgi:uncharacterized protein (DUF488 family)
VAPSEPRTLFTVGHSTRPFDEFVGILKAHGIATLADVRRYPRSRKFPYFNDDQLAAALPGLGLRYVPMKALGGRRRAAADSVNTGWTSEGFRGYADYMLTPAFEAGLQELIALASAAPTVIMCAEAVPWRCHRALIADAMLVRGWRVLDIMSETSAPPHALTAFARVDGTRITYPATAGGARARKSRKAKDDRAAGAEDASLFD